MEIRIENITKSYGKTVANREISFSVHSGEVLAVLGENGAGKTTLMRLLYGMEKADSGEIYMDGQPVRLKSPKDAISRGIGMVHQHFMLVNNFTVAENLILGMREVTGHCLNAQDIAKKVRSYLDKYEFDIDMNAKVKYLPVGTQQKVEILKALFRGAEFLILDEPTAVLTTQEIRELGHIVKKLRADGKTVILISHKLDEVMDMCDRTVILRNGKLVGDVDIRDVTQKELAKLMIGSDLIPVVKSERTTKGQKKLLEMKHISAKAQGIAVCKDISLDIWSGEIIGVAGVDGNGQTELVEILTGLRKADEGQLLLNGVDIINKQPAEIRKQGISHIPEDRHKRGLILSFSVAENLILDEFASGKYTKHHVFDRSLIAKNGMEKIQAYHIKTESENAPVSSLSGGNQQKIVVAREIGVEHSVLVAAKPTRGLDIGAVDYIHRCLLEERSSGKGMLLVSTELDEILRLSDRIAVMHGGELTGLVWPEEVTPEDIGEMMAGTKKMFTALNPRQENEHA